MTDDVRILRLRNVLKKVEAHLKAELERGYVLTSEPLAGVRWRDRSNMLLGDVEAALMRDRDVELTEVEGNVLANPGSLPIFRDMPERDALRDRGFLEFAGTWRRTAAGDAALKAHCEALGIDPAVLGLRR